ncbi:MAG: hypothetical protein LBM75_05705 [Myxococcales bacterium]|nr:hypothetical protein [Myxococcales bacterium]
MIRTLVIIRTVVPVWDSTLVRTQASLEGLGCPVARALVDLERMRGVILALEVLDPITVHGMISPALALVKARMVAQAMGVLGLAALVRGPVMEEQEVLVAQMEALASLAAQVSLGALDSVTMIGGMRVL